MSTFFFMGRNDANLSRVSWKLWRIVRSGKRVTAWWGPAHVVRRRVVAKAKLQTKTWVFKTENAARTFRDSRVREKKNEGYQPTPPLRRV